MRVLLATWGSRGDVEPMAGFAVALRELGAEVRMCAPPDFADLLARIEVNHQALFARVAAVVHHGGAGTTTTAATIRTDGAAVAATLLLDALREAQQASA